MDMFLFSIIDQKNVKNTIYHTFFLNGLFLVTIAIKDNPRSAETQVTSNTKHEINLALEVACDRI